MGVSCSRNSTATDARQPLSRQQNTQPQAEDDYCPLVPVHGSHIASSRQRETKNTSVQNASTQVFLTSEDAKSKYMEGLVGYYHESCMVIYELFAPFKTDFSQDLESLGIDKSHLNLHFLIVEVEVAHRKLYEAVQSLLDNDVSESDDVAIQIDEIQFKLIDIRGLFHQFYPIKNYMLHVKEPIGEESERQLLEELEEIHRAILSAQMGLDRIESAVFTLRIR